MLLAHDVAGEFAIGTQIEALGALAGHFTKTVTHITARAGLRNDILKNHGARWPPNLGSAVTITSIAVRL